MTKTEIKSAEEHTKRAEKWVLGVLNDYDLSPDHSRVENVYQTLFLSVRRAVSDAPEILCGKYRDASILSLPNSEKGRNNSVSQRASWVTDFLLYDRKGISYGTSPYHRLFAEALQEEILYRLRAFERCVDFLRTTRKPRVVAEKTGRRIVLTRPIWPFIEPSYTPHKVVKKPKHKVEIPPRVMKKFTDEFFGL